MKLPGVFIDIVNVVVPSSRREPHRPHIRPGDSVLFDCDGIGGDVPLTWPHPMEALEREAFTGRAAVETTGWIRKGQVALVIAVIDDHAFILGREGDGWGWVDRQFLMSVLDYSEATARTRCGEFLGLL